MVGQGPADVATGVASPRAQLGGHLDVHPPSWVARDAGTRHVQLLTVDPRKQLGCSPLAVRRAGDVSGADEHHAQRGPAGLGGGTGPPVAACRLRHGGPPRWMEPLTAAPGTRGLLDELQRQCVISVQGCHRQLEAVRVNHGKEPQRRSGPCPRDRKGHSGRVHAASSICQP